MKDITVAEWKSLIATDNNAVILDVRTQEEVDEGVLENSNHIDIFMGQGFIDEVKKLDPEKNYYIYCRSGGRSVQACTILEQLGFKNTYNMLGGYNAWVEN